jgi:hypothetical protein
VLTASRGGRYYVDIRARQLSNFTELHSLLRGVNSHKKTLQPILQACTHPSLILQYLRRHNIRNVTNVTISRAQAKVCSHSRLVCVVSWYMLSLGALFSVHSVETRRPSRSRSSHSSRASSM